MMSIFNIFDIGFYFFPCMFLLIFSYSFFSMIWLCSKTLTSLNLITNFVMKFFNSLKNHGFIKSSMLYFFSLFIMLFVMNFYSIMPFNFSITAQISIVWFLAFSTFFSIFLINLKFNFSGFLLHCIPQGAPIILSWFLFMVEILSFFIRPLTLTVRLAANILAGHLLLTLLSSMVISTPPTVLIFLGLHLAEFFVALIQSYIFVTMSVLYYSEI